MKHTITVPYEENTVQSGETSITHYIHRSTIKLLALHLRLFLQVYQLNPMQD